MSNIQDSSVILLDKRNHPKTLEVIKTLLPTFNIGYGDKEIYWIAAEIAQERYTFEPFIVAPYEGCGVLVHVDPNDVDNPENAAPMYINAEYLHRRNSSDWRLHWILASSKTNLRGLVKARMSMLYERM
eukprot:gene35537-46075_t